MQSRDLEKTQPSVDATLIESERRFRTLFEQSPLSVQLLSVNGKTLQVNSAWKKLWGFSEEVIQNYILKEYNMLEDTVLKETAAYPFVVDGFHGKSGKIPAILYDPTQLGVSGQPRWVEAIISPVFDDAGNVQEVVLIHQDVTDKMLAEEEMKRAAETSRMILETIPHGVWRTNPDGSADYFSPKFYEMVGYNSEEFLGWGWSKVIHPDDQEPTLIEWQRCREAKSSLTVDFRIRQKDGNDRWVRSQGSPFFDAQGEVLKYYGTWTDIHEQIELIEELRTAKEAAESANQMKSAFLANMSHEIRTPLGAILGFTDLIMDPELVDLERRNYHSIIKRNGEQLSNLIDDILDLSKIESGQLKTECLPCSVHHLVDEVCSSLQIRAREKGLELLISTDSQVPQSIITDPTRLRQILSNIIGNAVKFTMKGHVKVNTSLAANGMVRILIEDTGIGIHSEEVSNLFKPFSQADASITRKYGGTGLGLVLSKRLSVALGGDLILKSSQAGQGSVFEVTVRDHQETLKKETTRPAFQTQNENQIDDKKILENIRVLLVEDAKDNQLMISTMIQRYGATVEFANNGMEGLEKALRNSYDLVLMDIQMPIMDGYTATQYLRERGFSKPILALTAHAMNEVRLKCLNVGCSDYLTKPINKDVLVSKISHHVGRSN